MPRSSRHRSHRSHKHSRDRSDSEEDGSARERRSREEEPGASSRARVSRDPETGKRRSSHERAGKDLVGTSNGDVSGEHVKKRKERVEEVADDERWNGGGENDLKRTKSEDFSPVEFDKSSKSKLLAVDLKERSGRRHEDSNEREEDSGGKNDFAFAKLKSGKGSGRRESNSQYDDGKVSDKMERDSNKDRDGQDSRHDKSDELQNRRYGSKSGSSTEVLTSRKYTKITENKVQDVFNSPEAEKGFEKHDRKRDDSEDKDKWLDDGRDIDDRKQSSRDDLSKSRTYKDEKHEDSKHRGKYRNVTDKVQKYNDDKYQEDRLSKDRTSDKSEKWHIRDESKPLQSHYRKTKLQDADHDGTYTDDNDIKFKDSRGRKRYADEMEDHNDLKARSSRERREVAEKNTTSAGRTGARNDKPRSEYHHSEKTDSSPRSNRLKSSISSNAYSVKDHNRDISKLAESGHRELAAEERLSSIPASKGDSLTSAVNDRISGNRSGKLTKGDPGEFFVETTAASKYDRTLRSDARTSPNHSKRSPSTNGGRRISERSPSRYDRTARQRPDIEIGQRNSLSKDGDRRESWGQPIVDDVSQNDVSVREPTPVRPSSINRSGNLSDYSRNHLLPPTPMRHGSPSVLGPYQDDNRAQSSEHKSYNHHKRVGDLGFGRGHGNAWKNGPPTWPSPVANGFAPMQHGPPAGFHPAMSHFSAPPFFGVRPPMIHGVSYHMHDEADRFSNHGRPFGWHNPVDHSHLQMWDGSNGIYSNESHIYGRPEWDEGSQLGSRVWEMGTETWKGQNNNSMDIPISKKEQESSTNSLIDELAQSKCLLTESSEAKKSSVALPAKISVESSAKIATKTAEPSSTPGDEISRYVANYFSRIEISPDLVDPELLQRCTSLSETFDAKCSFSTRRCFQTNKDGSLVKMKSSSSMMKSFFPTAKDDLFKRAMSLYRNHAASLRVCSEKNKSFSEDNGNMEIEGNPDQAPRVKNRHSDDDSTGNMKAGNDAAPMDCDCPAANDNKKSVFMSDSVISTTSSQPCEALIEECSETVTRIPAH